MSSPIRALIWHEWRLYRWAVAVALFLYVSVILFAASDSTGNDALECALVLNTLVTLGMMLFLGFWRGGAPDLDPGFPVRMLTLPVRTSALVSVMFLFRVVLIAVSMSVALAISFICFRTDASEFIGVPVRALGCADLMALFLAATWFFSALGPLGNTVATFAVALPLALAGIWFLAHSHVPFRVWPVFFGAVPAGYAAALIGVALYRSGRSATALSRVMQAFPRTRGSLARAWWRVRRARPFASPMDAQAWFEWHRNASLLPPLALVLAGWLTAAMVLSESRSSDWGLWVAFAPLWLLVSSVVAAAAMGGLTVLRDYADRASGLAVFSMTRPISTAHMARARLKAGLRSVALTVLFMAVIFAALLFSAAVPGSRLWSLLQSPQFVPSLLLGAGCAVLGMWVLYWLAAPVCLGWGFFTLLYGIALLIGAITTGPRSDFVRSLETAQLLWVPAACVLLATAAAFQMASKRRLVSPKAQVISLVVWLAIVIPSAYVYYGRWIPALVTHSTGVVPPFIPVPVFAFYASLLLLAFAPLATVPLWLTWWRHR